MNIIIDILLIIWQFPQLLLGCFIGWLSGYKLRESYNGVYVYDLPLNWIIPGVSLGTFIFIRKDFQGKEFRTAVDHEKGHGIQSKYLGWFYLIVIGLPSMTFNIIARFNKKVHDNYYLLLWEANADRLGGVKR